MCTLSHFNQMQWVVARLEFQQIMMHMYMWVHIFMNEFRTCDEKREKKSVRNKNLERQWWHWFILLFFFLLDNGEQNSWERLIACAFYILVVFPEENETKDKSILNAYICWMFPTLSSTVDDFWDPVMNWSLKQLVADRQMEVRKDEHKQHTDGVQHTNQQNTLVLVCLSLSLP